MQKSNFVYDMWQAKNGEMQGNNYFSSQVLLTKISKSQKSQSIYKIRAKLLRT